MREVQGTQIGQRDALEDGWVNSGYVFSQPDGRAIDPDLVTKAFKKMVKEIGMPHLTTSRPTSPVRHRRQGSRDRHGNHLQEHGACERRDH
jgi:hypothetical protein